MSKQEASHKMKLPDEPSVVKNLIDNDIKRQLLAQHIIKFNSKAKSLKINSQNQVTQHSKNLPYIFSIKWFQDIFLTIFVLSYSFLTSYSPLLAGFLFLCLFLTDFSNNLISLLNFT